MSSSGPLSYTVQLPDGRTFRRHIDHIRKRTRFHSELDHKQVTASEFTEEAEVILPIASTDIASQTAEEQPTVEQDTQSTETVTTTDNDPPEYVCRYPSKIWRPPNRFVPSLRYVFI